jgi:hypothetical protein
MALMRTWTDVVPYIGDPAAPDTSLHLTDSEIAAALAEEFTPLGVAMVLSERHGRVVAAHDIRRRIADSPELQRVQAACEEAYMRSAISNSFRRIAEREEERTRLRQERQALVAEWRRLHEERVHLCELRRARKQARCGARTRTGAACERKPILGKARCACHGGASTGPRTPEGRARSLAALRRGRVQS